MKYDIIEGLIENGVKGKKKSVTVNNNKTLFNKSDYKVTEGSPFYFKPDNYGRSNGAIAIISKNTIPLVIKKKLKYPTPNGWNQKLEGTNLFERCHIIAYSLSAKFADKNNIFIGTRSLNRSIMKKLKIK